MDPKDPLDSALYQAALHADGGAHSPPSGTFLRQLCVAVSTIDDAIVGWEHHGNSFAVRNIEEFTREMNRLHTLWGASNGRKVVPFNFKSFVRQLNFWGFHKVVAPKKSIHEFKHPLFRLDDVGAMVRMRRSTHRDSMLMMASRFEKAVRDGTQSTMDLAKFLVRSGGYNHVESSDEVRDEHKKQIADMIKKLDEKDREIAKRDAFIQRLKTIIKQRDEQTCRDRHLIAEEFAQIAKEHKAIAEERASLVQDRIAAEEAKLGLSDIALQADEALERLKQEEISTVVWGEQYDLNHKYDYM